MPRTKKNSPAEDLHYLIALLPWRAGVGMAAVGYGVLHAPAAPGAVPIAQPNQIGQYVGQMMGKTLAYYGQFIVPVICLAGAALSAWRRRQRRALVATVTQNSQARANWECILGVCGLSGLQGDAAGWLKVGRCCSAGWWDSFTFKGMCTCSTRLKIVSSNRLKVEVTEDAADNDFSRLS